MSFIGKRLSDIYLFQVNNRNTGKRFEICSKLTIKLPKRHYWRRSDVFIVNFEHISHIFLGWLLVAIDDFEQVNVSGEGTHTLWPCQQKPFQSQTQKTLKNVYECCYTVVYLL